MISNWRGRGGESKKKPNSPNLSFQIPQTNEVPWSSLLAEARLIQSNSYLF